MTARVDKARADLASAEAKLAGFDRTLDGRASSDPASINVPLAKRAATLDAQLERRARLVACVDAARSRLIRAEAAEQRAQHPPAPVDLRASFGLKTEVKVFGLWFRVVRWNRKSALVEGTGGRFPVGPHEIEAVR